MQIDSHAFAKLPYQLGKYHEACLGSNEIKPRNTMRKKKYCNVSLIKNANAKCDN
jgi:hypothetical protein